MLEDPEKKGNIPTLAGKPTRVSDRDVDHIRIGHVHKLT